MTRHVEPHTLLALIVDSRVRGAEPAEDAVMRSPTELVPVTEASLTPLDIATYEVRLQRWRKGKGPRLTGMELFVATLRTLVEPTRVASITGEITTYIYLLDADITRVIAATAIDPPIAGASQ